ncbi:MAG: CpaF family protein, partial [Methyloceanibacter sp.]|nr:CpaF family protein [Methyloceanibacter sp.]
MFGKRSTSEASSAPRPVAPPAPAPQPHISARPLPANPVQKPEAAPVSMGLAPAKAERKPVERARSEEYYDVKTTVFNALIDTIDLTQLSKLDPDTAREEIREIVSEIVAIKSVVMSIAEQEDLLQDICNDVLGYGPLEPLLARDEISDVMVNGCDMIYIEVKGKVEPTNVRFANNTQLMNICQRIV